MVNLNRVIKKVGSIGQKIHLNKLPYSGQIYTTLLRSTTQDWLESTDLDVEIMEYSGYKLYVSPPRYSKYQKGLKNKEQEVQRCFERVVNKGDIVLDIGSHMGIHTLPLQRLVGNTGRVFALEAIPKYTQYLQKTVLENKIENITVENIAVSDKIGEIIIHITSPNDHGPTINSQNIQNKVFAENDVTISVESTTIGGYLDKKKIDEVDFVKMDVEGAEYDIIKNSNATKYIDKLMLELHTHKLGISKAKEIIEILEERGDVMTPSGSEFSVDELSSNEGSHVFWVSRE